MQRLIVRVVLFCMTANHTAIYAQNAQEEAAAAASSANITIQELISTPSASSAVPGYTSSPPETGYYGTLNSSSAARARVAACAASTDPTCEATSAGISSAVAPNPAMGHYDPDIAAARDIANNPGSILGDLSPYYAGCTISTIPTAAGFEIKKCDRHTALGRLRCARKLVSAGTGSESWDDGCAGLEANSGFGACTRVSGPTCVDGPSTKRIGGQDVFAACWEFQSTYDCSAGSAPNTCAPLAALGCTLQDSVCREPLPDNPTQCGIYQDTYRCPKSAGTSTTVSNCTPGCANVTKVISPPAYDTQSCYTYLERNLGQGCQKSLDVTVNWTCPAGSTAGPTRDDAPSGAGTWTCVQPQRRAACEPPLTGPTTVLIPPNASQLVCTDPVTGATSVAPMRSVDVVIPAIAVETERWSNGCAALEARVPPGLLPPDGVDSPILGPVTGGVLNKCERKTSECTVPAETRLINDRRVTRSCWGFTNTFDCLELSRRSDCADPRIGECTQDGEPKCIDTDAAFTPPVCTAWRTDFTCRVRDAVYSTVKDCGPEQPSADDDFARTVAYMEAGREAGRYLDPATMRVFKGVDSRCDKRLWGLVNCCKGSGSGTGSLLNNASVASTAVTAYKAVFSTHTYDLLFATDAPGWVYSAFETLSGGLTGFSSSLGSLVTGNMSFMQFLGSLSVFAWIAIIIAIIQLSGILDCPDSSLDTAMRREARLCKDLGEYCSSRSIFGSCITRTRTYCCFNSRLSRLINEQGRFQLGTPWGSARRPRCDGFTIDELQRLNFAAMDLTEFYAEIVPTMPDLAATVTQQRTRAPTCYYGNGKC